MSASNVVKLEVRRAKPAPAIKVPKKISDTWIRNLKSPANGKQKVGVADNLILELRNGGKYWNVRYTLNGSRLDMRVGSYPKVSFVEAKEERDEVLKNAAAGICPKSARKLGTIAKAKESRAKVEITECATFEEVATEWHKIRNNSWTIKVGNSTKQRLENHVYPVEVRGKTKFGGMPINELEIEDVLKVLNRLNPSSSDSDDGKFETRNQIHRFIKNVFEFSRLHEGSKKAVKHLPNPGVFEKSHLMQPSRKQKPKKMRALKFELVSEFLTDLEGHNGNAGNGLKSSSGQSGFHPLTILAIKLQMVTMLRPGEVRLAPWDEIDWEKRLWTIPAERMKMEEDHFVPLSDQAMELLAELHAISGHGKFLFPGLINKRTNFNLEKNLSETTVMNAIKSAGYTCHAHGFRHMASTYLNSLESGEEGEEVPQWPWIWVEYSLAHKDKSVRGIYDNNRYIKGRRRMMQFYADKIMPRLG